MKGIFSQLFCGRLTAKISEGIHESKFGEFYSIEFVGELQPNFYRESRNQKLGNFTALTFWEFYNEKFEGNPGTKNWAILQH